MNKKTALIIAWGLLSFFPGMKACVHAQVEADPGMENGNNSFFKQFLEDEAAIWTSPFHIKKQDLLFWAPVVAGTTLLIAFDEPIYRRVSDFRDANPWVEDFGTYASKLGDGKILLGCMGCFYMGGLVFRDQKARQTAGLCLQTFIHCGIVVQVMKHLTGRQRPRAEDGVDSWHGPFEFYKRYEEGKYDYYSAFPSGHAIVVWGTATVIAEQYRRPFYIPVICYSLAAVSALSRVTQRAHWMSDAVFGSALGFAIGRFVVRRRGGSARIIPEVTLEGITVAVEYRF